MPALVEALVVHVVQRQLENAAGPHLVEHAVDRGPRAAEPPGQRIDRFAAPRLLINLLLDLVGQHARSARETRPGRDAACRIA